MFAPEIVPYAAILLAGFPAAARETLTAEELSRCVTLLGRGHTLPAVLVAIQAQRPSLPCPAEDVVPEFDVDAAIAEGVQRAAALTGDRR